MLTVYQYGDIRRAYRDGMSIRVSRPDRLAMRLSVSCLGRRHLANLFLPVRFWGRGGSEHPDSDFLLVLSAAQCFGQAEER